MKKMIQTVVFVLVSAVSIFPSAQDEKMEMSLRTCLISALENNLDIAVAAFDPEIQNVAIQRAREIFYPQLNLNYRNWDRTVPSSWGLEGNEYSYKYNSYDFNLSQTFLTGGSLLVGMSNSATNTSKSFTTVNPSYDNVITFRIDQPLLKGFGPKMIKHEISKAENQREIAVFGMKSTIQQKIYEVEEAYWNLVYQMEYLAVQQLSLEQNLMQLAKEREAARIGTKSAIDVLNMEKESARWENGVVSARSMLEAYQDRLKSLMSIHGETPEKRSFLVPSDKPEYVANALSYHDALSTALAYRPEIASAETSLSSNSLDIAYYRNQILPQVNLQFDMTFPGQSGVRNVYLGNNPLTNVIIDQVVGSRWDSLTESLSRTYQNWSLTLNVSLPFADFFSRSNLVQAKIQQEQNELKLERTRREIEADLLQVYKELDNLAVKIQTAKHYTIMVEKHLEAVRQRYELGLESSQWLLSYQRDLADARVGEIKAITDYKIALAQLHKIMGTNIEANNLNYKKD